MDRRDFIRLTAVTGTTATLAGCGSPEQQLIRFVPDDELVPGIATWKPSICPACAAGCGVQARVMDADVEVIRNGQHGLVRRGVVKKLEGNPAHPASQGGLCARGQAAIQLTYHPDRITQPLKRVGARGTGRFEAVSWDEALGLLVGRLTALRQAGRQSALVALTGHRRSQRQRLLERFLEGFGAPPPVVYELFGDDVLRAANARSFGRAQVPTFDFAHARTVLSFGADFLGTWNAPVAHSAAFGVMRQGRHGDRGSFVQVEPRMSQTGANADEWVPAKPGTEGALALGLAHLILKGGVPGPASHSPAALATLTRAARLIDGWSHGLPDFAPEPVAQQTGVPRARIERLARQFASERPSVAVVGGAPLAQTNGLVTALAVNALNALVGAVEQPGGLFFTPQAEPLPLRSGGGMARIRGDATASGPLSSAQVLLIDGADPVFAMPRAWRVREALEHVPFIVSVGSFIDDTSALADLILPDHTFLESWVDAAPESGSLSAVIGVAGPAMRPLYDTRATADILLEVARRLDPPVPLPFADAEAVVKAAIRTAAVPPGGADPWPAVLQRGGSWGVSTEPGATGTPARVASDPVTSAPYAPPVFDGEPQAYPFHFLPYASAAFLDGSLAHLPWLQEMPDPLTSAMWSSWVEINTQTAARLGIGLGDLVDVASRHGVLRTRAFVTPTIAPDLVAMPVGQGHEHFTRYASGRGENPIAILAPLVEETTGTPAWAATRVRLTRAGDPDGRLILHGAELHEHPGQGGVR